MEPHPGRTLNTFAPAWTICWQWWRKWLRRLLLYNQRWHLREKKKKQHHSMYILRKDSTHYLHINTRKYTEQQIPNMHCMAKRLKKTCARQHHNIVEHLIPQSGRINMLLNTAGKAFHKILAAEIFLPFSHKSISKDRNWCVRCN